MATEYAEREARLPLGMTIDRHKCGGRIVVERDGARCLTCDKRFRLGVIVRYEEA